MEPSELLRFTVDAIEAMGLKYFVTGSMASMRYGEPRFTNDIDIVIDLPPTRVQELCSRFPEDDFYVSEDAARAAATSGGQFNVIHPESGLKVDLMIAKHDPLDALRLARAARLPTDGGGEAMFSSPEDIIVKKMDFFRDGESDKHLRDIASILKIMGDQLDMSYIAEWAARIGVSDVWTNLLKQTGRS